MLVTVAAVGQRGAQAVGGALVARISEPGERTRIRGHLRAVTNLGMGIGAAAAGVALQLDSTTGYTLLILANGLSFLAGRQGCCTALCLQWGKPGWVALGVVLALCGLATRPLTRWALRTRTFPAPEAALPVG